MNHCLSLSIALGEDIPRNLIVVLREQRDIGEAAVVGASNSDFQEVMHSWPTCTRKNPRISFRKTVI
jgi:hypothetical protein